MKNVFLHGMGQSPEVWKAAIKYAGLKWTDTPELFSFAKDEVTYDTLLAGIEKKYTREQEPIHLCGMGTGAILALAFAARNPEKVSKLVLIGAQYRSPKVMGSSSLMLKIMPGRSFRNTGLHKDQMIRLSESMRNIDLTSQLAGLKCPVLIVCGAKDINHMNASMQLQKLLPDAELKMVPNSGHQVNLEAPHALSEILKDFMK